MVGKPGTACTASDLTALNCENQLPVAGCPGCWPIRCLTSSATRWCRLDVDALVEPASEVLTGRERVHAMSDEAAGDIPAGKLKVGVRCTDLLGHAFHVNPVSLP